MVLDVADYKAYTQVHRKWSLGKECLLVGVEGRYELNLIVRSLDLMAFMVIPKHLPSPNKKTQYHHHHKLTVLLKVSRERRWYYQSQSKTHKQHDRNILFRH